MTVPVNAAGKLALPEIDGPSAADGSSGANAASASKGFAAQLSSALNSLNTQQAGAESAEQSVATGQSSDISQVMLQVEQASMSLELATQVRDKAVEAYQNIMQMQM